MSNKIVLMEFKVILSLLKLKSIAKNSNQNKQFATIFKLNARIQIPILPHIDTVTQRTKNVYI